MEIPDQLFEELSTFVKKVEEIATSGESLASVISDAEYLAAAIEEIEDGQQKLPEENPREKGDDDGVEYGDPRDHRDGIE